jgi:superoxide dismutase, Cu-Zn family
LTPRNRFASGSFVQRDERRRAMKRFLVSGLAAAAAAAAGCSMRDGSVAPAAEAPTTGISATADARTSAGLLAARATATQMGDSIRVRIEAMGMPRGTYAAHIHATGVCTPPDFANAGPHWNPTGREHGRNNPAGMHKGDLPNLTVGTDGRGSFEYTIPGAWVTGGSLPMLDADGAAVVIHAQADDYRSDPAGNAGARMACGVFR